jgi:hypothetical protein
MGIFVVPSSVPDISGFGDREPLDSNILVPDPAVTSGWFRTFDSCPLPDLLNEPITVGEVPIAAFEHGPRKM